MFSHLTFLMLQHYLAKEEIQKSTLCACNTVQLLQRTRLPLIWTMHPKRPKLNALITRFRESYRSAKYESWAKKTEEISSNWLNSRSALIQRMKNAIFLFPVFPGIAQAQVIWGGIVKHLLIAYFIGSICAKTYQNPFMCVKVIASQGWDIFLRHSVIHRNVTIHNDASRYFVLEDITTPCPERRCHSTFASNCRPIFKILSPSDLAINF